MKIPACLRSEKIDWMECWTISIRRKDGTEFPASGGMGEFPAVFSKRNRKRAVEFKRDLLAAGLDCRIVKVLVAKPVIIGKPESAHDPKSV